MKRRCRETAPAVPTPRDEPIAGVLRELADLRVALGADLLIAASAAEADQPQLVAGILSAEQIRLATFHERVLGQLAELPGVG